MTENKLFSRVWELRDAYAAPFWLLKIVAIIGPPREESPELPELKIESVSSRHAAAGASEPSIHASFGARRVGAAKSFRLSPGDGRRGRHERNWFSSESVSFINDSFQFGF